MESHINVTAADPLRTLRPGVIWRAGLAKTRWSWNAAPTNGAIASAPREGIYASPIYECPIRKHRFDNQNAAADALEQLGVQPHLAVWVQEASQLLLEELPALQTYPGACPLLQGPTSDGSLPRRSLLIQFVPSQ